MFWAPFWRGGGVWIDETLCILVFSMLELHSAISVVFVTSVGFVFIIYTYQVWILSLECTEWFFVTINVWLNKKHVHVCPWAINIKNTCILLPLLWFSKFQIPWNSKMVRAFIFSNSIMHISYTDPVYSLLQMVNVLSKTFKLITDFTSKSFTVN